jgi:hypothetical protein
MSGDPRATTSVPPPHGVIVWSTAGVGMEGVSEAMATDPCRMGPG